MKSNKLLIFVEGVLLIGLGIYALSNPGASILTLAFIFEWLLIISGIFSLIGAFSFKDPSAKSGHIIEAVLLIALGLIFIFANGPLSAAVLIYMVIGWFLFSSLTYLFVSFKLMGGIARLISIVLNLVVIVISIQALFEPALAAGIFVFTLSFNFILLGVNRILFVSSVEKDIDL